ncbi:MAG: hypothetical protein AAF481_03210 [Acidobacteriota bacterium]
MKRLTLLFAVLALLFFVPSAFAQPPCEVPDDGSGTVTMPPEDCGYVSPDDFHLMVNGLPPGTTIIVKPIHGWFVCGKERTGAVQESGCVIGGTPETGETEQFDSIVQLQLIGKGGALEGYNRTINVPANVTTKVGPRFPGDRVQSFETEMQNLGGAIAGDPDFAYLSIKAGSDNGLPSPGRTTLTQQSNGTWRVDSDFYVNYRFDFEGAQGSLLEGSGGTSEGVVRMSAAAAKDSNTDADTAN